MPVSVAGLTEAFMTELTVERFLLGMNPHMIFHIGQFREAQAALSTE